LGVDYSLYVQHDEWNQEDPVTKIDLPWDGIKYLDKTQGGRFYLVVEDTMIKKASALLTIDVEQCSGPEPSIAETIVGGNAVYQVTKHEWGGVPSYPVSKTHIINLGTATVLGFQPGDHYLRFRGWDEATQSWRPWSGLLVVMGVRCDS
jgi:hypothetical protein